jgi:hypothetical protein
MERDKYYIARKLLHLSATCAVMLQEASSKPPDFEPLVTSEERKALREKLSKQHLTRNRKPAISRRRRK